MIQAQLSPSELIGLAMSLLVMVYAVFHLRVLADRKYGLVTAGFFCFAAAYMMTNLEEFFLGEYLNIMEHTFKAAGGFLLAVGCRRVLDVQREEGEQR